MKPASNEGSILAPILSFIFAFSVALPGPATTPKALRASQTWNYEQAAHLMRRAGFGGTPEQIAYLTKLGRRKAVEYLVQFERIPEKPIPVSVEFQSRRGELKKSELRKNRRQPIREVKGQSQTEPMPTIDRAEQQKRLNQERRQVGRVIRWWIETMVASPRPLQEKLVLFWHGHFTSGFREVKSSWAVYRQNELFRKRGAGNFRDLLIDITEDPAMVLYLNTQQNRKGKPNENYARELMELFTMGAGHYTENDIKEAARAFTGVSVDPLTGEPLYRVRQHDFGVKTFLGAKGNFDPIDIIDIILTKQATSEFIARKFWTFFAYENPSEDIVKSLAKVLRDNKYELKPMLTAMFMSDAFYSERAKFTHIKSPTELLVGTLRSLDTPAVDTTAMTQALRTMGQELMQPPNVKGWDGGETWITTSTLFNRYNLMCYLIDGNDNERGRKSRERTIEKLRETLGAEAMTEDLAPLQPAYDPAPTVELLRLTTPEAVVDHYVKRVLQRTIEPEQRDLLIETFKKKLGKREIASPQGSAAIRALLHLIVSMPEYQLS